METVMTSCLWRHRCCVGGEMPCLSLLDPSLRPPLFQAHMSRPIIATIPEGHPLSRPQKRPQKSCYWVGSLWEPPHCNSVWRWHKVWVVLVGGEGPSLHSATGCPALTSPCALVAGLRPRRWLKGGGREGGRGTKLVWLAPTHTARLPQRTSCCICMRAASFRDTCLTPPHKPCTSFSLSLSFSHSLFPHVVGWVSF